MAAAWTNQDIIEAYQRTGSVWRAAKELGVSGQLVHQRLKAIGYKLASSKWTDAEDAELILLAGTCAIGQIATQLGRPYNGVALRLSRMKISGRNTHRETKIPRGAGYDQKSVRQYMQAITAFQGKYTQFCRTRGLDPETLAKAVQRIDQVWWDVYAAAQSDLPTKQCAYCEREFIPTSGKQQFCSRKCAADNRTDKNYFAGNRRQTIGLIEGICQLCRKKTEKGLSSHHLVGKDRDPDGSMLIALCPGCHQIVGILAGRKFLEDEEGWQELINLVMLRRFGEEKGFGLETTVDIDWMSEEQFQELYGAREE